ncbi:TPA: restriction endonuclease subunit S [Photobacterium damselae]
MSFEKKPITEIVNFNPKRAIKKGSVAPFIDMAALPISSRDVDEITEKEFKSGGAKFCNGDTLFARITPCLENGKTAKVSGLDKNQNGFGSTEFIVMSAKDQEHDEDYVYYLALLPEFRAYAKARMEGTSGRQRVPWQSLAEFEYPLPSKELRKLAGNFFRAIDDKISLNTQTNQTLERMAQAIFKSWFVDFDPVKAKMNGEQPEGMDAATASLFPEKLVESELGLIPEGWPVGKLSELIKFANGKSGKKSDSGRFPLYGANGIIGFSEEAKFEDAVIIGRVGAYCGAIEYCNSQFWASDNTIVATAKSGKAQLPFVLYLLKHLDLNQHAGGAAQPLLNQKVLNSLEIPIPTDAVLERYSELLSTMLDKMAHNIEENHNLERLRDTLLPKLLSGEIELGGED